MAHSTVSWPGVEAELGGPMAALDRGQKQDAVRRLDELGAFTLRRAVEDVADRLSVSRFTVYNYLNAATRNETPLDPDRGTPS